MELDLNGWATPTRTTLTDTGFGDINVWKAAAVSPNVAISSAYQMVGWGAKTGRSLSYMRLDGTGSNEVHTAGTGFTSSGITYALTDSSSTRLSLTLSGINLSQGGTVASMTKRFTFYPTGRVFVSYAVTGATIDMDAPRLDLNPRYDGLNPAPVWPSSEAAPITTPSALPCWASRITPPITPPAPPCWAAPPPPEPAFSERPTISGLRNSPCRLRSGPRPTSRSR
jgi:hypothetical protein